MSARGAIRRSGGRLSSWPPAAWARTGRVLALAAVLGRAFADCERLVLLDLVLALPGSLPEGLRFWAILSSAFGARAPRRLFVEHTPDFLEEDIGQARLGQKRITAGLVRSARVAGQRVPGHRHHRNVTRARVLFEPARRLPTIHARKREIHH